MPIIPINDCGKGVNTDLLPAELELGMWSSGYNFRFRNGFAERFEGITSEDTSPVVIDWMCPISSGSMFIGGPTSGYTYDGTTFTQITRLTPGAEIQSITFVGTTATVTTKTAHGLSTGNSVAIYDAIPATYNTSSASITVTGATTFTYTMGGTPATNAVNAGAFTVGSSISAFTGGNGERFSGGVLNGVLVVNRPSDGTYYYGGGIPNLRRFAQSSKCDSARIFKNYVIQLASTRDGTKYPHNVAWSAAAEPGSIPSYFTASATNDAGDVDLAETPGSMVDCLPLGDINIIYKEDALYAQQYIGGNDVFRFERIPGEQGLYYRDCVVDTPVGHVFLSKNLDVLLHQGGRPRSIANGVIKNWIASNIDKSRNYRAYLSVNAAKSEVWVCFSSIALDGNVSSYPQAFAVWNWESQRWSPFRFAYSSNLTGIVMSYARSAPWPSAIAEPGAMLTGHGTTLGLVTEAAAGAITGSSDIAATLERVGMHFDDRTTYKTLQRSRWNIDGTATQTATITHGSSKTADGTVTWGSAGTYTIGTSNFVDVRSTSGIYLAKKLSTTAYPCLVRSVDLDVTGGGSR